MSDKGTTSPAAADGGSKPGGSKPGDSKPGDSKPGCTTETCPMKLIEVHWTPLEAMCGDPVRLVATGEHLPENTAAQGKGMIKTSANKVVLTESSTGQSTFEFPKDKTWAVKVVVFSGSPVPLQHELKGEATAIGMTVQTPPSAPLVVKRIPDKDPEGVSKSITSGVYGWTSVFKISFKDNKFTVLIQMQYKKSWKGQWVSFDATLDGASGVKFIKKVGADWQFWNASATPPAWAPLPRAIGVYTPATMIFIKDGTGFKNRDGSETWPEAFPETPTPSFDTVKDGWLANIHTTWDGKFKLHRKTCPSSDANCCTWPIKIEAKWDLTSGEKLVYLIWTQSWAGTNDGRSNAVDWYMGDNRTGLAPHEFGHLLGAYDEYTGGAVDPANTVIDANTIMGQNLPLTAKSRHLDNLCKEATTKIRAWTSHSLWEFEVQNV